MQANQSRSPQGPEAEWVQGAEPLALCISCNATYQTGTAECPTCKVSLIQVRKCPACGRIQSTEHTICVYCANSFLKVQGLVPASSGRLPSVGTRAGARSAQALYVLLAILGVLAIAGLYKHLHRSSAPRPSLGKTFVTRPTPLLASRDLGARRLHDLKPSDLVDITDFSTDGTGTRWYEVAAHGTRGYIVARDVAPPKVLEAEKGFQLLQHYLVGMEDAAFVNDARAAVDYYRKVFSSSPHRDTLSWLLAEQTRLMAERSGGAAHLLVSAREQYAQIAQGAGSYAERARQTLVQLPVPPSVLKSKPVPPATSPGFVVTQGTDNSSYLSLTRTPGASIRRLTVLSETPLLVRLARPVQVMAGSSFQAEITQDIRVNQEVAVPKGSASTLTVTRGSEEERGGKPIPWGLKLTGMVIRNLAYQVSGTATSVSFPNGSKHQLPSTITPPLLPAGTRIEIHLDAPLAIATP